MAQKMLEKLTRDSLKEEVKALRSFIIGVLGRDQEGEYKPEFVRKIFKAAREKALFTFKNKKAFLRQIKKS